MDHTERPSSALTQKQNGCHLLPEEPPSSRKRLNRVPSPSDTTPPSPSTINHSMRTSRHKPVDDEATPIFRNGSSKGRNYQSTENVRDCPTSSGTGDENFHQRKQSQGDTGAPRGANNADQHDHHHSDSDDTHSISWYKNVADKFGSLELENKGSVARDHLALERTFLAWLRTSLAFASIGIAVTQLFRLNKSINQHGSSPSAVLNPLLEHLHIDPANAEDLITLSAVSEDSSQRLGNVGKPLGATFLGLSILVLLVGFHRYFESQYWITRGKFPASRGSVALIAFVAGALIVGSLVIIILVAPGIGAKV